MQNQSQNQTGALATPVVSNPPTFVLSASNKFAAQILRLYADLNLAHNPDKDAEEYISLQEQANAMEDWYLENRQTSELLNSQAE